MYKSTTYILFLNLIMHNFYFTLMQSTFLLLQTGICKPIF